jgi:hypothetical protein
MLVVAAMVAARITLATVIHSFLSGDQNYIISMLSLVRALRI